MQKGKKNAHATHNTSKLTPKLGTDLVTTLTGLKVDDPVIMIRGAAQGG